MVQVPRKLTDDPIGNNDKEDSAQGQHIQFTHKPIDG